MGSHNPQEESQTAALAIKARQAQYGLVARSALRAVPLNVVNALILTVLIYPYTNFAEHAAWLAVLIIAPVLRFSTMWRARRHDRVPTEPEMMAYVVLSGIVGVAWGATPFLIGPNTPSLIGQIIALVIAGMAAGAVLTAAGERRVIWAYAGPALSLWAVALIADDLQLGLIGAVIMVGFFAGMSLLARTYTQTLNESVYANTELEAARKKSTEQAAAMARLAEHNDQAARRAEEAARSSAIMLANMSHELRAPLNGVLGMAQLLEETKLDADQSRMIRRVRESGETLETLINTVLEVSRIDAGRMDLVLEDLCPHELSARIRREFAGEAEAKGVGFETRVTGDPDRCFRMDGGRITHMCRILLGNALEFTEQGEICLELNSDILTDGTGRLRVEVHDTGCGVPERLRDQLFTAMWADEVDPEIKESGTGLGLYLVRKLARMMNGETGYRPADTRSGSVFWFEVKLRASMKADRFADGEQMAVTSRRLRILVGESDDARRSVLLGYLKSLNCVVTCGVSSSELLDALNASAYDAIVLGQTLAEGEPEDACADVRVLPTTASMTPILRLIEDLDVPLRSNAMETQVRAPVSADNLLEGLKQALANDPIAGAQLHRIA